MLFGKDAKKGKSRMLKGSLKFLLFLSVLFDPTDAFASSSSVGVPFEAIQLKTFKTFSRLLIDTQDARVSWKATQKGFDLLIQDVSLLDLGVPFGAEKMWSKRVSEIKDDRLKSIKISQVRAGVKIEGVWRFPTGDLAPAYPKMETFDYHEPNPQRFVVDFWQKKGPTVIEVRLKKKRERQLAALQRAEEQAKRRASRRQKKIEEKRKAADLAKYCRVPISEKNDIFIPFNPVHQGFNFEKWLPTRRADSHYRYLTPKEDSKEAHYVRLAHDLYEKGRPALVVRTYEFFKNDFPKSRHDTMMRFLKANALLKLDLRPQAEKILKDLLIEVKEEPVALHSAMFLAARAVQEKEHLKALEAFLWLINNHSNYSLSWVFHLGAAEALYALKQTDRALSEYQWVEKHATTDEHKAEGSLRIGDLYLARRKYGQAISSYFKSLKKFRKISSKFPSVYINRAESLYWLAEYDQAEEAFRGFLKKFPGHPQGWRASFRIAEIYRRKEGHVSQAVARDWFTKTINQHPYTVGTMLARLRSLPCDDHGGLSLQAMNKFLNEDSMAFDGQPIIPNQLYREFRDLIHIRTLVMTNREGEAVALASSVLGSNVKAKTKDLVSKIYKKALRKEVLKLLGRRQRFEALAFFNRYSWALFRDDEKIIADFLLKLAQAATDLDLGYLSQSLIKDFKSAGNFSVLNRSPSSTDLDDLMESSEEHFTEARALWISSGLEKENEIRQNLEKVSDESKYSQKKEIILGLIEEKKGNPKKAIVHAIQAQLLQAQSNSKKDQRLTRWIASLKEKTGQLDEALSLYRKMSKSIQVDPDRKPASENSLPVYDLGIPALPNKKELLKAEVKILEKKKKWAQIAKVYSVAIEDGVSGDEILFSYARALRMDGTPGSKKKAKGVLRKIIAQEGETNFWREMAAEALKTELGKVELDK